MEYAILIYRDESETDVDWAQREADYEAYFTQAGETGILQQGRGWVRPRGRRR